MSLFAGINSVHTNAAHQAIRTMALTHSSSSTSGDSASGSRSPFVSPVQPVAPVLLDQSQTSASSPQQQPSAEDKDKVLSSTCNSSPPSSSSSSKMTVMATSSPEIISPPPPLLSALPAVNQQIPFSIQTLLPRSLSQGFSLGAAPSSSVLGKVQLPMQLPTGTVSFSAPAQPGALPSALPTGKVSLSAPAQPGALPSALLCQLQQQQAMAQQSGVLISGPINQRELDMLKDLQKKITERLRASQATVISHEESLADQGRLSAPTTARMMEWKTSMDSGPAVVEFTHCVAGPQEILEDIPFLKDRMRQLLVQHEIQIQYIDRQPHPPPLILPTSVMAPAAAMVSTPSQQSSESPHSHPTQQVSLREAVLHSRTLIAPSSISSSVPTVPSIASAPSTCIAATPTTSTVASCPFTLPTTGTPAAPNPAIMTLPAPYGGFVSPVIVGQSPVSSALAAATPSAQVQSMPVVLPQQAIGGGNYCILPSPLQPSPQLPVAGIISPPALSGTPTAVPAAAAPFTGLSQSIQPSPSILPGLTGGILLNNMAVGTAGGVNTPMYVVMPAYPTVLPTAPFAAIPQSAPTTTNPSSVPVLQVARSASVMLDHQRALQQRLGQVTLQRQDVNVSDRSRTVADTPSVLGKRVKQYTLPDSMGEKILKLENPAAVNSSASLSKYSNIGANQNHPRWSSSNRPVVSSGTCPAEVAIVTPHEHRTISSSDSDKSSKASED